MVQLVIIVVEFYIENKITKESPSLMVLQSFKKDML